MLFFDMYLEENIYIIFKSHVRILRVAGTQSNTHTNTHMKRMSVPSGTVYITSATVF